MKRLLLLAGIILTLSGCVAYPGYYDYGYYDGYYEPYYYPYYYPYPYVYGPDVFIGFDGGRGFHRGGGWHR